MKYFFSLILTCLLSHLSAQLNAPIAATSNEAYALLMEAEKQAQLGNITEAKIQCEKAIDEDSNYVAAHDRMAAIYRQEAKYDSAIYHYQKSLKINPRGLESRQYLAATYLIKENFDAAINQYNQLLIHFPDYPEAFQGLALVYFNQEKYPEAIKNGEKAMRLYLRGSSYRNAADARMLAGKAYLHQGKYNVAIKYFKACKKQLQHKPYYPYFLGLAYLKKGKKDKAQVYMSSAAALGYQIPMPIMNELGIGR